MLGRGHRASGLVPAPWPCAEEHELIDNGGCNAIESIDVYGTADAHDPHEETPLRDGPVHVRWDGECWTWSYGRTDAGDDKGETDANT